MAIKIYSSTHPCVLVIPFSYLKRGITWTFLTLFCSAWSPLLAMCILVLIFYTAIKSEGKHLQNVQDIRILSFGKGITDNWFPHRFWKQIAFAFASVMAACCLYWLTILEQSRYSTSSWVGFFFFDLCVFAWCFQICCTPVHCLIISSASSVTSEKEAPIVLKSRLNSSSWTLGR